MWGMILSFGKNPIVSILGVYCFIIIVGVLLAPAACEAASSIQWGDQIYNENFDVIGNDYIYLQEGSVTEVPFNIAKDISFLLDPSISAPWAYTEFYKVDSSTHARTHLGSIGKFGGLRQWTWTEAGAYEMDVHEGWPPMLGEQNLLKRMFAWMFGTPLYAAPDDFIVTLQFEVREAVEHVPPVLSFSSSSPYDGVRGVSPEKGVPTTTVFTFKTVYTDAGNLAPSSISAIVGTTHLAMTLDTTASSSLHDGNYQNGEAYIATTTISASGITSYSFEASNGSATTTLAGVAPIITKITKPSVLFLPGIESSYLYKKRFSCIGLDCEDQLWTPNIDSDVQDLYMNSDGTSVRGDIYTRDILGQYPTGPIGRADVYKTFSAYMDSLVASGTLAAWKAAPYDWRLSPRDLVNEGVVRNDGTISYTDTATSSYMVNQVLDLASTSGKVTIVAHSNGGLVAKELINKLIGMGKGDLIDNLILVASPQLGTPMAIPAMLHGYKQSHGGGIVTSEQTARTLARNMPDAYYLLPSAHYANQVATPVVTFDPSAQTTAYFRSVYGSLIATKANLDRFILGQDGRPAGGVTDTNVPLSGNAPLLASANTEHESALDTWTPPTTLKVYQLAGTGVQTLASTNYTDDCSFHCIFSSPHLSMEPVMTYDGDGTVISTSATGGTGEKWYLDVDSYNHANGNDLIEHSTVMSANPTSLFIGGILNHSTSSISFISQTPPDFSSKAHTVLRAHSPVSLDAYDNQGRHTGLITATSSDGTARTYVENGIPGVTYDLFGEVKYIYNDANIPLHIIMKGTGSGYLTYDMQQMVGKNTVASTTFINIPVSTSTNITEDAKPVVANSAPLLIDQNGDGRPDVTMQTQGIQYYDVTPPDVSVTFSTTTQSLRFIPSDMSPVIALTTATSALFTDTAGNTTQLVFSKYKVKPKKIELTLSKIVQNGVVVSTTPIPLTYHWNTQIQKGAVTFQTLASYAKTATSTVETHYRSKKNVTVVMTKPIELGDDDDGDDIDQRPVRQTVSGQHLLLLNIVRGSIGVSY
jgi:pimeloyl-ACP methyl ester carboxylesterase